jgi:hypothetical protein
VNAITLALVLGVIALDGEDRSRDADRQCRASKDAIVRAGAIAHRCSSARGRVAPGGKAADGSRVAPGDRRCSVARSLTGRPRAALVALAPKDMNGPSPAGKERPLGQSPSPLRVRPVFAR